MKLSVNSKLLLYADDSVLIVSDRDPNVVTRKLKADLESCNQWFTESKRSMYEAKLNILWIKAKL